MDSLTNMGRGHISKMMMPETIKIDREVRGYVVVGGYSKMADASIEALKQTSPEIEVKKFEYRL